MHILLVNDDGPPSSQSSPYVYDLIRALQKSGHIVSVVLPHTQRSWIGKAHIVGQSIVPSYYRPHPSALSDHSHVDKGTTSKFPLPPDSSADEWILIDSTPASCVQIGLFHYFQDRGPIDLVLSGPNYGRNTTAVFSLSSGTLGGALEAAVCGKRAIALSFAFISREHNNEEIQAASRASVKVIEKLVDIWDKNVHLYTVNVPLGKSVETTKILYTNILQNAWKSGSCFTQIEASEGNNFDPKEEEAKIRNEETQADIEDASKPVIGNTNTIRYTHKNFKWTPTFKDVYESVEQSSPGNDGWTVKEGYISVTPLRANFAHVSGIEGELKL